MPVPWGLVVKNGSKICSSSCGGTPVPVSLTDTRICPFSACCDLMTISRIPSTSFIASMLLKIRFIATCCNCTRSPMICERSSASSVRTNMLYRAASPRRRPTVSPTISLTSTPPLFRASLLNCVRILAMIWATRSPSLTILVTAERASSRSGSSRSSHRRQAFALAIAPVIGCVIS